MTRLTQLTKCGQPDDAVLIVGQPSTSLGADIFSFKVVYWLEKEGMVTNHLEDTGLITSQDICIIVYGTEVQHSTLQHSSIDY